MRSINQIITFGVLLIAVSTSSLYAQQIEKSPIIIVSYEESENRLTDSDKKEISTKIIESSEKAATILVDLPDTIIVKIQLIDRNIDVVDGVTGRTDKHNPTGELLAEISIVHPGGPVAAVEKGMESFIFHEFHHLTRGWSIYQNEFGPGIDLAAINEGLAVVFAEEFTGVVHDVNGYPEEAHEWAKEILELPKDASYSEWVSGYHPDGRTFIGYRTGHYIIRKAMENSGKSVLELSELTPDEIYTIAGF